MLVTTASVVVKARSMSAIKPGPVHRRAEARRDRLDQYRVGLVQRARLDRLDVEHTPHRSVHNDRDAQLRARIGLRGRATM